MARRRIVYGLALAAAILFQIYSDSYAAAFLLALTAALPVLALLVSLPAMLGCRVRLSPQSAGVVRGGEGRWLVAVDNRRGLPLARIVLRLELQNRMTGAAGRQKLLVSGASERRGFALPADTAHCGLLECRLLRVRVCDCLGLVSWTRRPGDAAVLPVLPVPIDCGGVPEPLGPQRGERSLRPRPGGGPGEDYDLRPYRPGDPVRLIHWKLSSKRDELVVREVLEERRAVPVLTFDHFGAPEDLDRVLDRLNALSRALLEAQRPHTVRWVHPLTEAVREFHVSNDRELDRCIGAALADPAPLEGRTLWDGGETPALRGGVLHIYIGPEPEETP